MHKSTPPFHSHTSQIRARQFTQDWKHLDASVRHQAAIDRPGLIPLAAMDKLILRLLELGKTQDKGMTKFKDQLFR